MGKDKGPGQDGWESVDGAIEAPAQANDMDSEGPTQRTKRDIARAEARRIPRWPDHGMTNSLNSSNVVYPREGDKPIAPEKKIHQFGLNEDFERTSVDSSDIDPDDQNAWGGLAGEVIDALTATGLDNEIDDTDVISLIENKNNKYGPGNYPSEQDYRSEGFYENLFAKENQRRQLSVVDSAAPPFTWLLPNYLAAGAHPIFTSHLDDLTLLRKAGFKAIISLVDKKLDDKYLDGFHYLFVSTVEGFSTDLSKICKFIDAQILLERPVFIHSLQGKGRAPTALAAYLLHKNYVTGAEEAIAYIRQNYQENSIETTYQEDALLKFALNE